MTHTFQIAAAILLVIITVYLYTKNKKENNRKPVKKVYSREEAEEFVNRLELLGYFRYAAPGEVAALKEGMIESYDPDSELTSIWDDKTFTPKDFRYYFCDGEDVYEQGGIINLLKDLRPTFDILGFKCEVTDHYEEWDDENKWLNHSMTLNGTAYTIFENFKETGWGEAPLRIAEILNGEMKKQGIEEKIYLASGGNDGRLVFLTDQLYKYISTIYRNPNWKPLELSEWARVMDVSSARFE